MSEIEYEWSDEKYKVTAYKDGSLKATRYGEEWRDLVGDGMVFAMLEALDAINTQVKAATDDLKLGLMGNRLAREALEAQLSHSNYVLGELQKSKDPSGLVIKLNNELAEAKKDKDFFHGICEKQSKEIAEAKAEIEKLKASSMHQPYSVGLKRHEEIADLKAEIKNSNIGNERIAKLNKTSDSLLREQIIEIADLKAELKDRDDWFKARMSEDCPTDEKHCGCVPELKKEVERLQDTKQHMINISDRKDKPNES